MFLLADGKRLQAFSKHQRWFKNLYNFWVLVHCVFGFDDAELKWMSDHFVEEHDRRRSHFSGFYFFSPNLLVAVCVVQTQCVSGSPCWTIHQHMEKAKTTTAVTKHGANVKTSRSARDKWEGHWSRFLPHERPRGSFSGWLEGRSRRRANPIWPRLR